MAWAYEDILKEGSEEYINRGIWLWRALYNRPPNHRKEAMLGISVEFNVFVSMKDKEGKKKNCCSYSDQVAETETKYRRIGIPSQLLENKN